MKQATLGKVHSSLALGLWPVELQYTERRDQEHVSPRAFTLCTQCDIRDTCTDAGRLGMQPVAGHTEGGWP